MGDAKLGERALASAVEVAFISSVLCMTYFLAALLGVAGSTVVRPGESWSRGEDDQLVEPGPELVATPGTQSRSPFWRPEEIIYCLERMAYQALGQPLDIVFSDADVLTFF